MICGCFREWLIIGGPQGNLAVKVDDPRLSKRKIGNDSVIGPQRDTQQDSDM